MKIFAKKIKHNDNPFVIKSGTVKDGRLGEYSYWREWIENSFVPRGRESEIVGRSFDFSNLKYFWLIIFTAILFLLFRVSWLQLAKNDYYRSLAEDNSLRLARLEAKRGVIYDRNKKPLVRNVANFTIYLTPADFTKSEAEREKIINNLSLVIFPNDEAEKDNLVWRIKDGLNKVRPYSPEFYQPFFVADNIDYEKAISFFLSAGEFPGVSFSDKRRREYLTEGIFSLSHLLGYTGKISPEDLKKNNDYWMLDYIGKSGLEYWWENELRGRAGKEKVEVDALGYKKKIVSQELTVDGDDLVLGLDFDLQKRAEEILSAYLKKAKLKKGSVIILDPRTGEILSLVSLPSYNNNLFARGIKAAEYNGLLEDEDHPLFNRAISGEYPSGSTIKPVMAAAALQERIISEKTSFFSSGGLRVSQWFFPDWRAPGHGWTNVRKALADSVNTFFYYIGGGYDNFSGLGLERIVKYMNLFNLGSRLGIDLPGEAGGFVPTAEWKKKIKDERWYIGDTYHLSIGQGDFLATPLQIAAYTSFFANGGTLYKPHLVKEIITSKNDSLIKIEPKILAENIIDKYNVEVVRQGMRQAVTAGSAKKMQSLPVTSAGKTGTAQHGGSDKPHAWYTGFAPYKNPEITITVLVEEGVEGSQIAADVARDIMMYYFTKK